MFAYFVCKRYLDTSLIDVDVQPKYCRVTVKGKVRLLTGTASPSSTALNSNHSKWTDCRSQQLLKNIYPRYNKMQAFPLGVYPCFCHFILQAYYIMQDFLEMKNINYDIKRTILFFSTAIAKSMATLIFLKNLDSNY